MVGPGNEARCCLLSKALNNFFLYVNEKLCGLNHRHPPSEIAVSSEVNTLTETSLARVPFSTLTVALTLPASSLTEYPVMLKPIVTPKEGINNDCS